MIFGTAAEKTSQSRPFAIHFLWSVVLFSFLFSPTEAQPQDCRGLIDSMIARGVRYLDCGKTDSARQFLTAAYKCGMSIDSMQYFAAEIFLATNAIDTALIFNMALERAGKLQPKLYLEQRYRILRKIGLRRAADSIRALYSKTDRHDIRLSSYLSRNFLAVSGLTFMPQQYRVNAPPDDTCDGGKVGITYRWSRWNAAKIKKMTLMADLGGDFKIPTRYSFNDTYDTLIRSAGCGVMVGEFPKTPELHIGYRSRFHTFTENVAHSVKVSISKAVRKYAMVNGLHEMEFIKGEGIDNSRSEISGVLIRRKKWISGMFSLGGAYVFSRSSIYQSRLDTNGVFKPLRIGFVDSLRPGELYHYFTDQSRKIPYQFPDGPPDINPYWGNQSHIQMLAHLPEHSINLNLRTSLQYARPKLFDVQLQGGVQLLDYIDKASWYAIDDPINVVPGYVYNRYTVIHDGESGKLYLHTEPKDIYCNPSELKELKLYKKRRTDCYITIGLNIERNFKYLGKLYCSGAFIKAYSTLDDSSPVARLRHAWQVSCGWSRDVFLEKR